MFGQSFAVLLLALVATVLSKSYTITQFKTEAQLSQDCKTFRWPHYECDIQFKETVSVSFFGDSFSGFERLIPIVNYTRVNFQKVTDLNGNPYTVETTEVLPPVNGIAAQRIVWRFPSTMEPQTFVLSYSTQGILKSRAGPQLAQQTSNQNFFDWIIVGNRWPVNVGNVSFIASLPFSFSQGTADIMVYPAAASTISKIDDNLYQVAVSSPIVYSGDNFQTRIIFSEKVSGCDVTPWYVTLVYVVFGIPLLCCCCFCFIVVGSILGFINRCMNCFGLFGGRRSYYYNVSTQPTYPTFVPSESKNSGYGTGGGGAF